MEILLALGAIGALAALLTQSKPLPSEADFKKAVDKLLKDPKDPDANLVAGKYLSFVEGDYKLGMTYLSNSNDPTLKMLGDHEIDPAHTDNAPKKVGMGDEWVAAAKKFPALFRIFYERAGYWYSTAWPDLDAAWKTKLRDQATKLAAARPQGGAKKGLGTDWSNEALPGARPAVLDGTIARTGSYSVKMMPPDEKVPDSVSRFRSARIPVTGKSLEISAWVRSDGTDNGADRMFMFYVDNTGTGIGTIGPFIPVDMPFWTRVSQKVDALPAGVVRLDYGASMSSKKGNIWIDDMSVKIDGKEVLKNGSFEN